MRYPTSLENLVRTATLTATNVVASSAFELLARDADGGGTVDLSGSYTGADDAVIDIEVTSDTINGSPQISSPVFSGVGNGVISGISATSGIAAQEFSVTVLDLGTPTRAAFAPFQSGNLRAKTVGTGGNALSLRISQAGLTATATDYAVTRDLGADAEEFVGEEYNFGAISIEPEGTVPTAAARIRFGDDITVYRHWREFREGRYRYHFSPAIQRDIPIGTRVYSISGGRTVEVLDGVTVEETYIGITTLYSLLSAIQSGSALIEYDGVIAADRRPGGMACDDLAVYTASYSAGSVRDGTSFIRKAVVPLTVPSAAASESLSIVCLAAPIAGAEIWQAAATVAGDLGTFVTGEDFTGSGYALTIPIELQPGTAPAGDRSAFLELVARDSGDRIPSLCVKNFLLGSEAQTRTYTFEWRPHPGEECDCRTVPISGGPNNDFLGIDDGGVAVATLPATLKTLYDQVEDWRLQSLHLNCYFTSVDEDTYLAALVAGLNEIVQGSPQAATDTYGGVVTALLQRVSAVAKFEQADIAAIELVANLFQQHLLAIYDEKGGTGDLATEIADEFQTQWDFIVSKLTPLMVTTNNGGPTWKTPAFARIQLPNDGGNPASVVEDWMMRAIAGARNLTSDLVPLTRMVQACIGKVYIAGDMIRPFDVAARTGNAVWQDHNGTHWFASTDGLLPIQPGYYYHSCRMEPDDLGEDVPTATREFGIGVAIGCEELLQVGDKLIITTSPYSNGRATYQAGDSITWQIVRADPVQLGGGQIGSDTIRFGVRGSVVGALDPYDLVTTAPTGYSNGGLAFSITPGAIEFEAGDRWTFSAEGGEFRWRMDGGSWTAGDIAGSVSLTAGINAVFRVGATPSFVVGDTYQLAALASNGAGKVRKPDGESLSWTGSLQLDITPTSGAADTLMIGAHTIPSTATIVLTGSNDNFATAAYTATLPWRANNIGHLMAETTCAKWRLAVNESGSIDWLYLGVPSRLLVQGGLTEHGIWTPRRTRLANGQRTRGLSGSVEHSLCTADSVDDLLDALEYAHTNDDGRIGAISPESEAGIYTVPLDIEISDTFGHQPAASSRLLSLSIDLTPI